MAEYKILGISRGNKEWKDTEEIDGVSYTCYKCGKTILSNEGYIYRDSMSGVEYGHIYICHNCDAPTYITGAEQVPAPVFGFEVMHLPDDIEGAYKEARNCFSVNAYTSAVLCCRKILMYVACEKGAKEGKKFIEYVNYLNDEGFIPPDGKGWVDKIRTFGNDATHKLDTRSEEDAKLAINFTGMLLKFIYEMPGILEEINK